MYFAASVVIGLVAIFHVYIMVLEKFLWDKPAGLKALRQSKEATTSTKVLVANQGLYNGF
jgi:putative membrane protein